MIPNQTLVTSLAQHVLTAQNTSHSWDAAPSPQGCISMVTADYPDDPISQAVEHWISKGKGAIILPVLFLLGTVGICLSLTSFYRQGLKHRINLCLFSLEFIHLLNIAFLFLLNIDSVFLPLDSGVYGPVYQFLVNHRLLGMLGFMYGAMYLTAVASCERCLTVLFPLQSKTLLSTRTMYVVIICGTCLTTLPFFVVTARYQVTCFFDVVKNSTVLKYTVNEYYFKNKDIINAVEGTYFGLILSLGLPFIVCVCTALTGFKLKQTITFRKKTSSSDTRKEAATTKMLIIISIIFLVLSIPNIFIRMVPLFQPEARADGRYNNSFGVLINGAEVGSAMNSSVNVFVYYFSGTKFRENVQEIFRCQKREKKSSMELTDHSQHQISMNRW
ncbi:type-2 angiotensin II receptor-like [Pomacea canaliculata]|uniref:type-2 angiotensin II receptor-like n=1 Tax=Pomacea canaliculata TaxID=400727 RepID=UPI000D7382CF|nr:type-2 angiotensin II receptor-like [Pomacea canaliculata]